MTTADLAPTEGTKRSSRDRDREAERLELREGFRPDVRVLTDHDLGIDITAYGSDYPIGKIPTSRPRSRSSARPPWETEIVRDAAVRLDLR